MPHYGTFSVLDYSEETSSTSINFGAITAISIAGFLTQWGALRTAFQNLILGTIAKEIIVMDSTPLSNTPPASPNAQNELKFQFSYEGNTSKKKYRFELPCDPSKVLPGTDIVDLSDADVAAAVTAFETIGRTPDNDQEGVTVLGVRLVGRNI